MTDGQFLGSPYGSCENTYRVLSSLYRIISSPYRPSVPLTRALFSVQLSVTVPSLDGQNREIAIAESLVRARFESLAFNGGHITLQNTEIGPRMPCVRCTSSRMTWIVRLAFIRATCVPRGTVAWFARVDHIRFVMLAIGNWRFLPLDWPWGFNCTGLRVPLGVYVLRWRPEKVSPWRKHCDATPGCETNLPRGAPKEEGFQRGWFWNILSRNSRGLLEILEHTVTVFEKRGNSWPITTQSCGSRGFHCENEPPSFQRTSFSTPNVAWFLQGDVWSVCKGQSLRWSLNEVLGNVPQKRVWSLGAPHLCDCDGDGYLAITMSNCLPFEQTFKQTERNSGGNEFRLKRQIVSRRIFVKN